MAFSIFQSFHNFDPSKLDNFHSRKFDSKINKGASLKDKDKIELGKELWNISTNLNKLLYYIPFTSSDNFYKQNADKYIQYKLNKNIRLAEMGIPLTLEEIDEQIIDVLTESPKSKKVSGDDDSTATENDTSSSEEIAIAIEKTDQIGLNSLYPKGKDKIFPKTAFSERLAETAENDNLPNADWLLQMGLTDSQVELVNLQYKNRYPLIRKMIKEIQFSKNMIEDRYSSQDQISVEIATQKLKYQLLNLTTLSMIIEKLLISEEDHEALIRLNFTHLLSAKMENNQDISATISLLAQVFSGEILLSDLQVGMIIYSLMNEDMKAIKEEINKPVFPISQASIEAQAKLHKAMREGKSWAASQQGISKFGTSGNTVSQFMDPQVPSEVSSYFKVGSDDISTSIPILEKMVWDIAVILGIEENFTPTGLTTVYNRDDIQKITDETGEKPIIWEKLKRPGDDTDSKLKSDDVNFQIIKKPIEEKEENIQSTTSGKKGSIQPSLQGESLTTYRSTPTPNVPLTKSEVMSAIFSSLVIGMVDGHPGNMIITPEGKIKFFDNSRGLPHSNILIDRTGSYWSPYRCALLDIDLCLQDFTADEKKLLAEHVQQIKHKIPQLEVFIRSDQFQQSVKKFPPQWFNTDEVLTSMKERIARMETALKNDSVQNLTELVIQTIPNYKLHYIVALLKLDAFKKWPNSLTMFHEWVGAEDFLDSFSAVMGKTDLARIKNWCDDPTLTLQDTIDLVSKLLQQDVDYPPDQPEILTRLNNAKNILYDIPKQSKFDFKDLSKKSCIDFMNAINQRNIAFIIQSNTDYIQQKCILEFTKINNPSEINDIQQVMEMYDDKVGGGQLGENSFLLLCRKGDGAYDIIHFEFDTSKIGFVKLLENPPRTITLDEFVDYIKSLM